MLPGPQLFGAAESRLPRSVTAPTKPTIEAMAKINWNKAVAEWKKYTPVAGKMDGNHTNANGGKLRSRSGSGVRLEYYQRLVYKTILKYQV